MPPSSTPAAVAVQSLDLVSRILGLLRWDPLQLDARDLERHQGPRRQVQTWQIVVGLIAHALPFAEPLWPAAKWRLLESCASA